MAAHTRQTEEQELAPQPEVAAEAQAAAPAGLSPARILALQASAGNAAVARMLSLMPTAGEARAPAGGRTLARFLDYDGLAQAIHDACAGLGTDEAAIFSALSQLNRDPAEVDRLLAAYNARFG